MRAYVFTDPTLTRHAGRFVWLELDTEKARNAAAKKRLGVAALPTYLILDPADERVALRWVGGFTVAQLDRLLDDGVAAVRGGRGGADADTTLARADRLYGDADYAGAASAYGAALARAPGDWPQAPRARDALMFALDQTGGGAPLLAVAREAWPRAKGTPYAASAASSGLSAALGLADSVPGRAGAVREFEADAREVLADTSLRIAADDRSGLYIALVDARRDAKDEAGAKQVAAEWSAFLDGEAARARTPEQRAVFDSHRLSAYRELRQLERAIPMLEQSERDLPDDYNPPARLALAYSWLRRWDEALAASDRALGRAYGPRKLTLLAARSDIYAGKGDKEAARKALEEAIALGEALPPGQRSEGVLAQLRKKLEALKPS